MPEVIIPGPAGRLEGRYYHSKRAHAPVALVLHPHPQHGGTMNNKITYTMYQAFQNMGFSTLRFNFRGVGRSQGEYDKGEGELADAAAALDWLQTYNPNATELWITGFSFGAWVAMQLLMRRPETDRFLIVSPPANMYDFAFLAPCPCSGLIVHGAKDEIVPEESASKLVQKLRTQKGIVVDYDPIEGAGHFYNDKTDLLAQKITSYVQGAFQEKLKAAS